MMESKEKALAAAKAGLEAVSLEFLFDGVPLADAMAIEQRPFVERATA